MPSQFPCVSNQVNTLLDEQIVPMEKRTSEAQSINLLPEWALGRGWGGVEHHAVSSHTEVYLW